MTVNTSGPTSEETRKNGDWSFKDDLPASDDTFTVLQPLSSLQAGDSSAETKASSNVVQLRKSSDYKTGEETPVARRKPLFSEELPTRASKEIKNILDEAFFHILNVTDIDLDPIERSNQFDDWTDELRFLSRRAFHFKIKHRKILGALLIATKDRDIVDFSRSALDLFRETTNALRNTALTEKESDKIIFEFSNHRLRITYNLSFSELDDENGNDEELKKMMEHLLNNESKYK